MNAIAFLGNFAVLPSLSPSAISSSKSTRPSDGISLSAILDSNSAISFASDALFVNLYSTTSKPSFFAHSNCFALEFSKSISSAFTTLKTLKYTFLSLVTAGFNCLTEPEQRFLGFLYLASASLMLSFILLKSEYFITASPLSISSPLYSIFKGTF